MRSASTEPASDCRARACRADALNASNRALCEGFKFLLEFGKPGGDKSGSRFRRVTKAGDFLPQVPHFLGHAALCVGVARLIERPTLLREPPLDVWERAGVAEFDPALRKSMSAGGKTIGATQPNGIEVFTLA